MELSISDVEGDAYQNFLDSIRDFETLRKYNSYLDYFLKLIPNEMYKKYLGYEPESRETKILAQCFTKIANEDVKIAKQIIKAYVRDLKKQIKEKKLSAGTAKNRLKPIKSLLKSNEVEISWYLVDKSLPKVGRSTDRAYTRDELKSMMKKATDLADKVIITCASSGGFRVEAWNYFTWNDFVIFYEEDGSIEGGALCALPGTKGLDMSKGQQAKTLFASGLTGAGMGGANSITPMSIPGSMQKGVADSVNQNLGEGNVNQILSQADPTPQVSNGHVTNPEGLAKTMLNADEAQSILNDETKLNQFSEQYTSHMPDPQKSHGVNSMSQQLKEKPGFLANMRD